MPETTGPDEGSYLSCLLVHCDDAKRKFEDGDLAGGILATAEIHGIISQFETAAHELPNTLERQAAAQMIAWCRTVLSDIVVIANKAAVKA